MLCYPVHTIIVGQDASFQESQLHSSELCMWGKKSLHSEGFNRGVFPRTGWLVK